MEGRDSSCLRKWHVQECPEGVLPPLPRSTSSTSRWALRGAADGKTEFNFTDIQSKQNNVFNIPAV